MDRSAVAELIAVVHELRKEREELKAELAGLDGEDLGAELAADELEPRDYLPAATITGEEEIEPIAILEYNPGGELAGDECRCNSCLNPSVND